MTSALREVKFVSFLGRHRSLREMKLGDVALSSGTWQSVFTFMKGDPPEMSIRIDESLSGLSSVAHVDLERNVDQIYLLSCYLCQHNMPWPFVDAYSGILSPRYWKIPNFNLIRLST